MKKRDIDLKDLEILNILQVDAAITNRKLAQRIGLSPGPTLVRVQKLFEKGVIKNYIATPNYTYLGYIDQMYLRMTILPEKINLFRERVLKNKRITKCVEIVDGTSEITVYSHTYFLTVLGKSQADCKKTIDELFGVPSIALAYAIFEVKVVEKDTGLFFDKSDLAK